MKAKTYLCNRELQNGYAEKTMKRFLLYILCLCCPVIMLAQRHEILNERIQSLTVQTENGWQGLPVTELGRGVVEISFDDMSHEYRRYAYRVEQCNADWTANDQLFESDFMTGFTSDNIIEDVGESLLTTRLYTHYRFQIGGIKLSGNYRVTVYDDNADDRPVLTACFMVVEPTERQMGISLMPTAHTDATINTRHQQVGMELSYGNYTVSDPSSQLNVVVVQNGQWHDARRNIKPQYVMPKGLRWDHNRDLIFDAGNEYHKFEILQTDAASMGIDHIAWDSVQYHAYPFINIPRPNYLYDQDADGAYLLRNSDNANAETESDYMLVHFRVETPRIDDADIYVNGGFTNDRFLPKYKMEYDAENHYYETVVLLKFGYYNYQYLAQWKDGRGTRLETEGNFYQTENTYEALVYFREPGGRYDRLVGYNSVSYRPQ